MAEPVAEDPGVPDPTGEPLLDVRFPRGVRITAFGSEASGAARAVGVHLGDLGVQSVRAYRTPRPTP